MSIVVATIGQDEWSVVQIPRGDAILQYGPQKGESYASILHNRPEYLEIVKGRLEGQTIPKHIQQFCDWIDNEVPGAAKTKLKALGTRKCMLKKLEAPCPDGCTEFTKKGTNYKINMKTSLVCGHGTQETQLRHQSTARKYARTM